MSDTLMPTPRSLLAAENGGSQVITRGSDGMVFIQQPIAERAIERLLASILKALNYIRNDNPEYAQEILEDAVDLAIKPE